jgi:type II secretory pathway pseudopilin PulG
VLIVVVIMAVLAATIIPQFSSSTQDAKESSLKFNVHTMRSQIELYKVHHLGGYPAISASSLPQLTGATNLNGEIGAAGPNYPYGPYVDGELPANPFNDLNTVVAGTGLAGDGTTGWQYDETTGGIWPNHSGWTP